MNVKSYILEFFKRNISRGFDKTVVIHHAATFYSPHSSKKNNVISENDLISFLSENYAEAICVVLPTYIGRNNMNNIYDSYEKLVNQLTIVRNHMPDLPLVFFVGIQWKNHEKESAISVMMNLIKKNMSLPNLIEFVGIILNQNGKVFTLNTVFNIADKIDTIGVCYLDDDVTINEGGLSCLFKSFIKRGARGSVGASKYPIPRDNYSAKLLHRAKKRMKTSITSYPHGCCIIIDSNLVHHKIPERYSCDDGFFCFSLINMNYSDPMADMYIDSQVRCYHYVGGPFKEIYFRIRRSLLDVIIYLSDFPTDKSLFYFSEIIFAGLWPINRFDSSNGFLVGVKKCLLKWTYFIWFCEVCFELFARGIFGKPLKEINWAPYSDYKLPPAQTKKQ